MTWISNALAEKEKNEKQTLVELKQALAIFDNDQNENVKIINLALKKIEEQGLQIKQYYDGQAVYIYPTDDRVRVGSRFKQFFYEPWEFRVCKNENLPGNQAIGVIWEVRIPDSLIKLNICLYGKTLTFRSGYKNKVVQGSYVDYKKVSPSYQYGLKEKVEYTQYESLNHPLLGKVESNIKDYYGETVLTDITEDKIIGVVYGWFQFAKDDI